VRGWEDTHNWKSRRAFSPHPTPSDGLERRSDE